MFLYAVSFSWAFDEKFIKVPWSLVLFFFFFLQNAASYIFDSVLNTSVSIIAQ